MMRDKALTPGISRWDKSAARSWGPLLGDSKGEGLGKRERRRWGWGTPNMEAQFMRTRWRVDWMTLWGKERKKRRGKKGAHKAVRVQPSFLYHWLSVCQMPGGVSARKCFSDRPTCVLHIFRCVYSVTDQERDWEAVSHLLTGGWTEEYEGTVKDLTGKDIARTPAFFVLFFKQISHKKLDFHTKLLANKSHKPKT